jgi:hypothetical protein
VKRTVPAASAICTPRRKFSLRTFGEYREYSPSRVQCHTYTAAPANGLVPPARSVRVSSRAIGTPSARPLAAPKLERMSPRTMPESVSTFGPFEPSPGYGPAVSSGISPVDAATLDGEPPHAAIPTATTPRPSARSSRLRPSVARSKPSPWSTTSSCGRGSGLPSYVFVTGPRVENGHLILLCVACEHNG